MPKKIKKYEYQTLSYGTEDFDIGFVNRDLSLHGENGWELVSVNTITGWHESADPDNSCRSYISKETAIHFFMKRERA